MALKTAYLPLENMQQYNSKISNSMMQILNSPNKSFEIR